MAVALATPSEAKAVRTDDRRELLRERRPETPGVRLPWLGAAVMARRLTGSVAPRHPRSMSIARSLASLAVIQLTPGCSAQDAASPHASSGGAAAHAGSVNPAGGSGGSAATMAGAAGALGAGAVGGSGDGGAAGSAGRTCVNQPQPTIDCGPTCTAVRSNGPPPNRVSLALMGEGFTAAELESVFVPHAEVLAKYMFENVNDSEPYVRYRRFINFYRIDLVSQESGIDDPGAGHYVDTPLDGEVGCSDLPGQMCTVRWSKALAAFDGALAGSAVNHLDWRLLTLNYEPGCGVTHYPQGGALAIYCPYQNESPDIALHEGGHGFHFLADTYWTIDEPYVGKEPSSVNLTKDPTGAKWQRWLDYVDPVLGAVGAFEGGGQYTQGLYRPSLNQKMGSKVNCHEPGPPYCPHDAVSREQIIFDIYKLVRPLDAWTDNQGVLTNPQQLTVDVVDCDVVKVDWYVDGVLVAADFGEQFTPSAFGVPAGRHSIEARAHDDTEWVRSDREPLQQVVSWEVDLL